MATDSPKQLGMIGLGRMGANIVRRIMRDGHSAVVYDTDPAAVADLVKDGAVGANSIAEFVEKLDRPRNAWIMVPAGKITDAVIKEVADALEEGDTIIDGGNSYYRDDIRRSAVCAAKGVDYLDVGTSGGVWGKDRGYSCLLYTSPSPRDRTRSRMPSSA